MFDGVGLRYGTGPEVLSDVSFALPVGGFFYLMGPSGAGKSSLLRLMYLAQQPSRGLIQLFGRDINQLEREDLPPIRRKIGTVFQDFRLLEHMSVFENVALPLRVRGVEDERVNKDVGELLNWVELGDRRDDLPSTLSGGEQQRVAIARAVINNPRLLIADEPTGNVDDRIATRLMYLFEALNQRGTTVIIATHSKSLVKAHPHPVLQLKAGQLQPLEGIAA
ncbi:MAG: cell division ATP-binding protein FtsE [Alphaproteobacteria bacterium]